MKFNSILLKILSLSILSVSLSYASTTLICPATAICKSDDLNSCKAYDASQILSASGYFGNEAHALAGNYHFVSVTAAYEHVSNANCVYELNGDSQHMISVSWSGQYLYPDAASIAVWESIPDDYNSMPPHLVCRSTNPTDCPLSTNKPISK